MTPSSPDAPLPKSILRLSLLGLGHVPAMKNNKMLTRGKLITSPKRQKWMQQAVSSFECQLWFACQTIEGATSTEHLQHFLTVFLPCDDAWQHIPEIHLTVERVAKSREGAEILIERL